MTLLQKRLIILLVVIIVAAVLGRLVVRAFLNLWWVARCLEEISYEQK